MVWRSIAVALVGLLFAASAVVFEAASATSSALDIATSARISESPAVRDRLLDRAETTLLDSWAQPTLWHAGAAEALSGVYLLKGEAAGDAELLGRSADWAVRTLRMAPVQPNAWTRLALLAERGRPNPLCDVETCLVNSWRVAAVTDAETACLRLQIAHRRGLLTPDDPRVDAYLQTGVSRRAAAACLSFMAPADLFEALMRGAAGR